MTSGPSRKRPTPAPAEPARAASSPGATARIAAIVGFEPAAVIFDLDGVLADTEPINQRALGRVLADRGAALSDRDFVDMIGLSNEATWAHLIERFALTDPASSLTDAYVDALLPLLASLRPAAGAVELVTALEAAGVRLAVASSSPRGAIDGVLAAIGLRDHFETVVSDADVQNGKPAPDIFLLAARRLGADPAGCVVIEDSLHGLEAARRAGMAAIANETPYNRHADLPARSVPSLTALLPPSDSAT